VLNPGVPEGDDVAQKNKNCTEQNLGNFTFFQRINKNLLLSFN
jgi:hypothetical protein